MIEAGKRLVVKLPLVELWSTESDLSSAHCLGTVSREELTDLIRQGPVWFVVADVGLRFVWIDLNDCYAFWKNEVKPHLAGSSDEVILANYPDRYAYVAKRWATDLSDPVVVLEKHH